jgi:hypothetical protein
LLLSLSLGMMLMISCNIGPVTPDVKGIKVGLVTKRFEKEFFSIDTAQIETELDRLEKKYPDFLNVFIFKILGLEGIDSSNITTALLKFMSDYRPIYDSSKTLESSIGRTAEEIEASLKLVKYYFPAYPIPKEFITFIGPIDAFAYGETGGYGEIITPTALCSGLQLHLGDHSMVYKSEAGLQLYPEYISRRFTVEYIPVNCIKNIIDDIYPSRNNIRTLIDIMIEHGKRMYLLDILMPETEEALKLGYTKNQLKGVKENEGFIWNFFTENNLLYETDIAKIRSYVSDGPYTTEFGEQSPGFVSLFIGRQIIQAYMNKHPETKIDILLSMEPKKILSGSAYKPR